MAFGTNAPNGFVPTVYRNGTPWNGQLDGNYKIQNGYANNIGIGDFVAINFTTGGYVVAYYDAQLASATNPILGVFMGCDYEAPTSTFPIPTPIQKQAWIGGTQTKNGQDVVAYIMCDFNVLGSMQCTGALAATTGFTQSMTETFAPVTIPVTGSVVNLGPNGTSTMSVNLGTAPSPSAANYQFNVRIRYVDPNPANTAGPYNNALVQIQYPYAPISSGAAFIPA